MSGRRIDALLEQRYQRRACRRLRRAAPATNSSEITVTGIRASLQKSLDIKRDSDGIVDAISAEDIGKFPDSNLATPWREFRA